MTGSFATVKSGLKVSLVEGYAVWHSTIRLDLTFGLEFTTDTGPFPIMLDKQYPNSKF
jgi:hypothetical protein